MDLWYIGSCQTELVSETQVPEEKSVKDLVCSMTSSRENTVCCVCEIKELPNFIHCGLTISAVVCNNNKNGAIYFFSSSSEIYTVAP